MQKNLSQKVSASSIANGRLRRYLQIARETAKTPWWIPGPGAMVAVSSVDTMCLTPNERCLVRPKRVKNQGDHLDTTRLYRRATEIEEPARHDSGCEGTGDALRYER